MSVKPRLAMPNRHAQSGRSPKEPHPRALRLVIFTWYHQEASQGITDQAEIPEVGSVALALRCLGRPGTEKFRA